MNSNVAGNMVALAITRATFIPRACEAQVVFTDATNMVVTQVAIEYLGVLAHLVTTRPSACQGLGALRCHSNESFEN